MTWSTSDVALCCFSESLSSRVRCCSASNSRTFSMAIAAWSANVARRSMYFGSSGRTSARRITIAPSMQNAGDEFPPGPELAVRHGHRTALSVPPSREGRASATWTGCRSHMARPATVERSSGSDPSLDGRSAAPNDAASRNEPMSVEW
jgi:hypothetical protein